MTETERQTDQRDRKREREIEREEARERDREIDTWSRPCPPGADATPRKLQNSA